MNHFSQKVLNSIPQELKWSVVFISLDTISEVDKRIVTIANSTDYYKSFEDAIQDILKSFSNWYNLDTNFQRKANIKILEEKQNVEQINLSLGRHELLIFPTGKPLSKNISYFNLLKFVSASDLSSGKLKDALKEV